MRAAQKWSWLVLLAGLVGCSSSTPPAAPDTGAKKVVQDYGEAVVRRNWPKAYALLHPDNHKQWPLEQFTRLAESYRRNLEFEPQRLHIRSCEEQTDRVVAHVVFIGGNSHQRHSFNDGLTLYQAEGKWLILLTPKFGKK
ncbi:nuclear transport factor 2 family protein [Zavarzinella formosa]|uniref:hypothetical protein n=1 Tax=Zavarzinella formosa TaxID=360055 RepID=UPI000495DEE3|nr:hypothetical protein [Zavarzinella formosa]